LFQVSFNNVADGRSGKDKEHKKPDAVLPCARCNSTRTKFCYYNNYNVNQPRYYCKDCKRHWTVGGLLRDVPIGTARRKIKNNGDAADTSRDRSGVSKPLSISGPAAEGNRATTSSSVLKLLDKSLRPPHNAKEQNRSIDDLIGSSENNKEKSYMSYVVASGSSDNSGFDSATAGQLSADGTQELVNSGVNHLLQMPPTMPDPERTPALVVPSPQVPFYWSCNISGWSNATSSVPWPESGGTTLTPSSALACSVRGSLALGKHPREEGEVEKTFWVPKALRVTDPKEVTKSTIWTSLGIEPDERILKSKDENGKALGSPAASCSISCSLAFHKRI
jgi:hypothetical protein